MTYKQTTLDEDISLAERHFDTVCFAEHAKRQGDTAATSLPHAEAAARHKLDALRARRSAIAAGKPDPTAPPPPVYPRSAGVLMKPARISGEPDESWRAVASNDNLVTAACEKVQRDLEFGRVVHSIENTFEEYANGIPGTNAQVAFTRGFYGATMQMFATVQAEIMALHQVAATLLRKIDERIEALENGGSLPETMAARREVLIRTIIDVEQNKLKARLDALENGASVPQHDFEARIAALESGSLRYMGVFDRELDYTQGQFVTHDGSLWHANIQSKGVAPGTAPAIWTLAVKRGRDSKGKK